jgi:hypothetical protein
VVLDLEPGLVDAMRSKRAILFLGAGASLGAKKGTETIPDARTLGKLLCGEFLSNDYEA